jgi:rubredoxin
MKKYGKYRFSIKKKCACCNYEYHKLIGEFLYNEFVIKGNRKFRSYGSLVICPKCGVAQEDEEIVRSEEDRLLYEKLVEDLEFKTMTLDEAILHAQEQAEKERCNGKETCAKEHLQLAKWLIELKILKEREIVE